MAIHLLNNELGDKDKYVFPAFVPNILDCLYEFNDKVLDRDFVINHKYGDLAIKYSKESIKSILPENRRCIVDNQLILNEEDYLYTGLLTSNSEEDLFNYNFITINKNNLSNWEDRGEFISYAKSFINDNKWKDIGDFKYLENLILEIGNGTD